MIDRLPLYRLTMPRLIDMILPADAEAYRICTTTGSTAEALYSPQTRNLVVDWGNDAEGHPLVRRASGSSAEAALATVFPQKDLTRGLWTLP